MAWLVALSMMFAGSARADAPARVDEVYSRLKTLAAEKAYEIRIAREASEQRDAHLYTSWARWLPRLDLQLAQSRSKDYSIITSGALGTFGDTFAPQSISLSRWSVNLTFPIYDRSVHVGVLQGGADRAYGDLERSSTATQLDWRLRQLFGACLLEAYRDAALKSSIDLSESNLRDARLRFELGQKTKVDVLRAQAHRTELESRRLSLARSAFKAKAALLEYAGITPEEFVASGAYGLLGTEQALAGSIDTFAESGEAARLLEPYLAGSNQAVEERISSHSPEFHRIKAQEELSERQSLSLTATEWPSVRLQGSWNKQAPEWGQAFEGGFVSYSTAVVLTVPIFTGCSLFSSPAEARHAKVAAQLRADRGVLELRDNVEGAILDVRTLRKSVESLKLSLEQNEEIVRLERKSYQLGKATIVEMLGAENDLIASKVALANAKIDLSVQLRQLAWNLGLEGSP